MLKITSNMRKFGCTWFKYIYTRMKHRCRWEIVNDMIQHSTTFYADSVDSLGSSFFSSVSPSVFVFFVGLESSVSAASSSSKARFSVWDSSVKSNAFNFESLVNDHFEYIYHKLIGKYVHLACDTIFFLFLFFLFGFYGPFKNISLISSRSFIKGGRKPEYPEKNHLTIRKQNLAFPHDPS